MHCTIPDANGVDREYDVTTYAAPVPGPGPHYLLKRIDTAGSYVVALTEHGPVCSCKDFSCNGKGNTGQLCKHAGWCLRHSQNGTPAMLATAKRYHAAGLNVIPVRPGTKEPALPAGHPVLNHERRLTETELLRWWGENGLAVKGGALSGHLEILDLDRKDLWDEWAGVVDEEAPGLLDRLPRIETGKGWHVYWRCPAGISGNLKLAREAGADGRPVTLAETRGEGGYVLAPPTRHPDGSAYKVVRGDLTKIPDITADERTVLLDAARSLNRWAPPPPPTPARQPSGPAGDDSPGNDFNKRADFARLLQDAGWVCERVRGPLSYWRRPGKYRGVSATLGLTSEGLGRTLFYVFSSNAYPLEPEKSYDAFGFFCRWFHGGDMNAGARALLEQGYGTPSVPLKMRYTPLEREESSPVKKLLSAQDTIERTLHNDLLDADLPPPRWMVQGLVIDEGFTLLGGKKKLGKSWLCLQISQAVAKRDACLGRDVIGGRVVYLCLEDGKRRLKSRLEKQHSPRDLDIVYFTRFPKLDSDKGLKQFIDMIEGETPRLLIVDTLAAVKTGKVQENDAGPMADLGNLLRALAQQYGIAVLCTHHHGKLVGGDPGDDLRGSSALAAAADVNLGLYKTDYGFALKGEGRDIEALDQPVTFDAHGAWVWQPCERQDRREDAKTEADEAVIGALRDHGECNAEQVATVLKIGKTAASDRLAKLAADGRILFREQRPIGAGRPMKLYSVLRMTSDEGDAAE
jgi:hypothetical protein